VTADQAPGPTAWIVVSPELDPLVAVHIEHDGGEILGEAHEGDDWRAALAWARARTDRVYIRLRRLGGDLLGGSGAAPAEP